MEIRHVFFTEHEFETKSYNIELVFNLPFRINHGDRIELQSYDWNYKKSIIYCNGELIKSNELKHNIIDDYISKKQAFDEDCYVEWIEIDIMQSSRRPSIRFTT